MDVSMPSMVMWPELMGSMRRRDRRRDVLPLPEGPQIRVLVPGARVRETSFSVGV